MNSQINFNLRATPVIDFISRTGVFHYPRSITPRMVKMALPILALYKPMNMFMQTAENLYFSGGITADITNNRSPLIAVSMITALATSYFFPVASLIFNQSASLLLDIGEGKNYQEVSVAVNIAHKIVFVASIALGAPELIAISLIAQASFELYKNYRIYQKEQKDRYDYLEFAVNFTLVGLRINAAIPQIQSSYFKWAGKTDTVASIGSDEQNQVKSR